MANRGRQKEFYARVVINASYGDNLFRMQLAAEKMRQAMKERAAVKKKVTLAVVDFQCKQLSE